METFQDMLDELSAQLMAAASSTVFNLDRKKKLLNNAYTWAKGLYEWSELERGRDTESVIDQDYYDYPEDFRTDTLGEYIYFNGQKYDRKAFKDFKRYRSNFPTSTKRIFADYGRQYFIFPTPTVVATIEIWGQVMGDKLVNLTDTTIFSKHGEEGNEAIVERAVYKALRRIEPKVAEDAKAEAVRLLAIAHKNQESRQQTEQTLDKPMFEVPNFFPESQLGGIGFGLGYEGNE